MDPVSTQIARRLALVLLTSFGVCATVVLTQRWHGRLSLDHDLYGAQKLHRSPVPRVGGLGLFVGLLAALISSHLASGDSAPPTLWLLVSAVPVYLSGLIEDLTKRVKVRTRLIASFVSAGLAIWLLDARLMTVDTPILDTLLSLPAISVLFTIFAVAGVTHSINIIDGLNGLAAGAVSIMLAGLAAIAWQHGDYVVMKLCLWGIAAMAGFLILNYPFGRIFLGDGGAYLAGFWLAECSVLLLVRNPSISTWAVLLACFYPVWETVFSMYRRHVIQRVNSGQPDFAHLHQLIYQGIRTSLPSNIMPEWLKHGVSSAAIWAMSASCAIVAFNAQNNTPRLVTSAIVFAALYYCIYQALKRKDGVPDDTANIAKI